MLELHNNKIFNNVSIDLLVGGPPCQSFSIAGQRGGMDDARGNLSLEYCRILDTKQPRWFVFENVPGLLSSGIDSNGQPCPGKDFATLLSRFTGRRIPIQPFANAGIIESEGAGYSIAWRVLDAQFFGVPQRRRRVFIIGNIGTNWRAPAAVLFDSPSSERHIKKSRKKRQEVADPVTRRPYADRPGDNNLVVQQSVDNDVICLASGQANSEILENVSPTLNCNHEQPIIYPMGTVFLHRDTTQYAGPSPTLTESTIEKFLLHENVSSIDCRSLTESKDISGTLQSKKSGGYSLNYTNPVIYDNPVSFNGQASVTQSMNPSDIVPTLDKSKVPSVMIEDDPELWAIMPQNSGKDYKAKVSNVAQPLMASGPVGGNQGGDYIQSKNIIRRITPLEAERLQGFPDYFTNIPWKKKKYSPDSLRYSSVGNSMAVPVMQWIGKRIDFVDKLLKTL